MMNTDFITINGLEIYKDDFFFLMGTNNFHSKFQHVGDIITFRRGKLRFSDNYWDFTTYDTLNRSRADLIFDFEDMAPLTKDLIKNIIFNKLFKDELSFSTVKTNYYSKLKKIDNYLSSKGVNSFININKRIIETYIDNLIKTNIRLESIEGYKAAFLELIKQVENLNIKLNYKEIYKYLFTKDRKQLSIEREEGKTDIIPREFFKSMVSCALDDIKNTELDKRYRKEAAIVLLFSQLGVRIGELRIIQLDRKKEIFKSKNGESVSTLFYKTYKTIKNGSFKWTTSFLTPEAELAYDLLSKFAYEEGNKTYLFENKKNQPLNHGVFRKRILQFVVRNRMKIQCINISEDKLKSITVEKSKTNASFYLDESYIEGLNEKDTIYFPSPHQFRVTLATILYEKGVHLDWIRKHMNHLTPEMTLHYIREEEIKKESVIKISEFIKDEVSKVSNVESKSLLYKKIDKFIQNNKINIEVDVEKIIEELKGNKPLREKKYGYCIKSNFGRKCPKNEKIDIPEKIENHIPTFEFINITYSRFLNMTKAIAYNDKNGFTVEKTREIKRLKRLINNYLLAELNELKSELLNKGLLELLKEYRHLEYMINNITNIEREVYKWI